MGHRDLNSSEMGREMCTGIWLPGIVHHEFFQTLISP